VNSLLINLDAITVVLKLECISWPLISHVAVQKELEGRKEDRILIKKVLELIRSYIG
jgi:hypothetical protein